MLFRYFNIQERHFLQIGVLVGQLNTFHRLRIKTREGAVAILKKCQHPAATAGIIKEEAAALGIIGGQRCHLVPLPAMEMEASGSDHQALRVRQQIP